MANKNQNTGDAQGSTLTPEQTAATALAAAEKAEAEAKVKVEAEKNNKRSAKSPYDKLAKEYAALYPEASEFHITTDMQVFLPNGLNNAKNHQRTLDKGELTTIKVK